MPAGRSDANDAAIGRNIRLQRQAVRMSQGKLGARIGVSFQQVQKYERGKSRIGISRLIRIATALRVPLSALLEGIAGLERKGSMLSTARLLAHPHRLRLLQAFIAVEDVSVRRALLVLTEEVSRAQHGRAARRH
jgi:transcriptional regulator with XRE-family HTH domain